MLEIKDVVYSYDKRNTILNNITANFEKGILYCIEGKSGSGKTTLLSLMSGLDKVDDGDIMIDGESLKRIDLDHYRSNKIGVIFQSYNLLMQLTGLQNILLSMYISKVKVDDPKKHVFDLLNLVGISQEKANRKVIELSGGEQQRIAIARAISHSPDYIFADEPTGNLDKKNEKNIMEIFKELVKQGKCIIIVTHSSSVTKYSNQIYKMKNGELQVK